MIVILEDDQIASIFVAELKRQILALKEIIDTDDGSFDEDIRINNKTFKALLKVLKYNSVEDDYIKWVKVNLNYISKPQYTLKNTISCKPDDTYTVNKKLLENFNISRKSLEEDIRTPLNKPDKEICSFNEKPKIIEQMYRDWNIEVLDKPYYGNDYAADYWTGFLYDSPVMLFDKTLENIKAKIDMFYLSHKLTSLDKVDDVENTFK